MSVQWVTMAIFSYVFLPVSKVILLGFLDDVIWRNVPILENSKKLTSRFVAFLQFLQFSYVLLDFIFSSAVIFIELVSK